MDISERHNTLKYVLCLFFRVFLEVQVIKQWEMVYIQLRDRFCLKWKCPGSSRELGDKRMEKRKSSILIRFILRAILGLVVIFGVNQFLDYRNIPVSVGINLISFLTSGTLGIPGVCLLYGIMFYQIM